MVLCFACSFPPQIYFSIFKTMLIFYSLADWSILYLLLMSPYYICIFLLSLSMNSYSVYLRHNVSYSAHLFSSHPCCNLSYTSAFQFLLQSLLNPTLFLLPLHRFLCRVKWPKQLVCQPANICRHHWCRCSWTQNSSRSVWVPFSNSI